MSLRPFGGPLRAMAATVGRPARDSPPPRAQGVAGVGGGAVAREGGNGGPAREGFAASPRAGACGSGEGARVGKAVGLAEPCRGAGVPGQQRDVLEVEIDAANLREERFRGGYVVFRISVGRFELEVLRADGGAAAGGLLAGARPSGYRVTRRWAAASPVEQRIVHWILDELRDLLRDRLDVGVSDHRRRNSDIGGEDERVVGGGVDTVRTPGTADCGVSEGVIGRVVSHGKHEPAVLCGDLAEQFALNPFEVNDGKRAARFRGGENVPRASGN